MITIKKIPVQTPQSIQIVLEGTLDAENDLTTLESLTEKDIHVNCAGIRRSNSIGLKGWIQVFKKLTSAGAVVQFHHLSPPLIDQLNILKHFLAGGKLVSILLPYNCTSCSAEQLIPATIAEVRKISTNPPPSKCPKCGGATEFDDDVDQFFQFLTRI